MPSPFPDFDPVSIWRAHLPRRFEVYPVRLPQRLPRILVPSFDRCYGAGRYRLDIDYTQPPPVPLTDGERKGLPPKPQTPSEQG